MIPTDGATGPRAAAALLLLVALASTSCSPAAVRPVTGESRADRLDAEVTRRLEAGDVEGALALQPEASAAREELLAGDHPALAEYFETVAVRLFATPEATAETWDMTEAALRRALELRRRSLGEDHPAVADTLENLSTLAYQRSFWKEAEELQQAAVEIRRKRLGPDDPAVAAGLRELGAIYYQQGKYADAEAAFDAALAIFRRTAATDPLDLAEARGALGEVYRAQGRYREAEEWLRESLDLARQAGERADPVVATLLNNLAGLYKDQSRYDEGEKLFTQAVEIWDRDPGTGAADLAIARMNLAEYYRLQGRYADAERLATEALARAREILGPDSPDLAWYLDQLALALVESGRTSDAEALYREAIALLERAEPADHPLLAKNLTDLAALLRRSRRYGEAEPLYRRALQVNEEIFGPGHPETAAALARLARCAAEGGEEPASVLELADRALQVLGRTSAYPEAKIEALAAGAEALRRKGDPGSALRRMVEALAMVEELRPRTGGGESSRAEFLSRYTGLFDRMVAWQVAAGQPAAALETAERARARVLLDQLAAERVDLRRGIPDEVLRPLERSLESLDARLAELRSRLATVRGANPPNEEAGAELRQEIQSLEDQLDTAGWERQTTAQRIRDASPLWREVITAGGKPVPAADLQEVVPRRGWLLVYEIGEEESFLFTVPPAPARLAALPLTVMQEEAAVLGIPAGPLTAEALERVLSGTAGLAAALAGSRGLERETSPAPGTGTVEDQLHALWRVLIPRDFAPALRRAEEVVIVPDGALHRLPFEALVVQPPPAPLRYWIDAGPVARYAPSATALYNLRRRGPRRAGATPAALVVADPVFDRGDGGEATALVSGRRRWERAGARLARLPGTAREAAAIRRALGQPAGLGPTVVLADLDAEEARVRTALRERPRYLHFATHGLVDEGRNEILAALALTPPAGGPAAGGNDGLLQLFEIYELDLDNDLVVLSACQSQAGRQLAGEGVFALSRGFLAAGARRTVASLWPADDDATALLMGDLYQRLAAALAAGREPDYARALHDARLALRRSREWAAPAFWAPFVFSGIE